MSEFPHIEVDEVTYFEGWDPRPLKRPCRHFCPHNVQRVIAWGPTWEQYELLHCDACGCRAWLNRRACDPREDQMFWNRRAFWWKPEVE